MRLDADPYYTPEAVEKAFSGCEELVVEVFTASFGVAGYAVLVDGFGGVRGIKRARIKGSVGDEFRSWLQMAMQSPVGTEVEQWNGEKGWAGGGQYDVWRQVDLLHCISGTRTV